MGTKWLSDLEHWFEANATNSIQGDSAVSIARITENVNHPNGFVLPSTIARCLPAQKATLKDKLDACADLYNYETELDITQTKRNDYYRCATVPQVGNSCPIASFFEMCCRPAPG